MPRVARRIALCLLAGLVLSLVLAGAIGLRLLPRGRSTMRTTLDWDHGYGAGWLMTSDQTGWGWTRRARNLVTPQSYGVGGDHITMRMDMPSRPSDQFPVQLPPRGTLADLDEARAQILRTSPPSGTLLNWPIQMRTGWPARCLTYWHDGAYGWGATAYFWSAPPRLVGGHEVRAGAGNPFDAAVLPYRPLWGGLAINTLAYGAALFAGITGLVQVRTRRRARQGRCLYCGYEVRGLAVCPECGRAAGDVQVSNAQAIPAGPARDSA